MRLLEGHDAVALRFTAGGRCYAIPVAETERVLTVRRQAISPIPFGLGRHIAGLFSFRGAVLPLVRVAELPAGEALTVILLGAGDRRFGLAVDDVSALTGEADGGAVTVSAQSLYEGSVPGV